MTNGVPSREEAWGLLCEWTESPGLRGHAMAVEASMRAYAAHFGEDAELWGVVGLLHDFDYERHPTMEDHPYKGAEALRGMGYSEEIVDAIMSHADYTGVPRDTLLKKALFAVDELSGLVVATALVAPDRKLAGVKASSVKKKMKRKDFARSVSREDIRVGAEELGVDLDEHIARVVAALQDAAADLGL